MGLSLLLLLLSMAVILLAAELFTNSVEWFGHRMNLGEGAVGSLLAAVGTAMPETIVPLIAILFVGGDTGKEIGVGAIIGAPFMLATAAFFVNGASVFLFSFTGRRDRLMAVNGRILQRDIIIFFIVFLAAVSASFLPGPLKVFVVVGLLVIYGAYVFMTLRGDSPVGGHLNPLHFHRRADVPHLLLIVLQLVFSLALMVGGARVFVAQIETIAHDFGISALVLALLIAPLATELPEKFNSVIWVRQGKDTLAMGNVTGAMVFQTCIPVSVGLLFTPWVLDTPALVSAAITLASTAIVAIAIGRSGRLEPQALVIGGPLYLAFGAYVIWFL